jgi:hypothetical protein
MEEGPIPAVHGVVRWRACDLVMRLHDEFGISISARSTVFEGAGFLACECRAQGVQAGPRSHGSVQKNFPPALRGRAKACAWHTHRSMVPGRDAGRPEEQADLSLGQKGPFDLSVRCDLPRAWHGSRVGAASLQQRGHAAHLDEIATKVSPGAHAILLLDQAGWHGAKFSRCRAKSR